ncbi:C2 domain protein [Raphanus sativus]|nr:C2 domain protein [Raphanus sativus]
MEEDDPSSLRETLNVSLSFSCTQHDSIHCRNQEFMLSVPESYGPVKLEVYDYDTFSADDIMGETELDIQPLITSGIAFGDTEMLGDMQIGKWMKSHDNPLIDDSIINIVDGKVKQEVQIKLHNVVWRIRTGNGCHLNQ